MPRAVRLLFGLVAGLSLLTTGCAGYQLGTRSLYRPDIRTVFVPVFESDSYRRNLGEQLTEAVVKEIELRTPYKVVHHPDADSVLTGRLISATKNVVAENRNDIPRDIETDLVVQVDWRDQRGQFLLQEASFTYSPLSFSVAESTNLIPEAGQSVANTHLDATRRLAQQIVVQMQACW